jgi:hypothetical protein
VREEKRSRTFSKLVRRRRTAGARLRIWMRISTQAPHEELFADGFHASHAKAAKVKILCDLWVFA